MAKTITTILKSTSNSMYIQVAPGDNAYTTGGITLNLAPGSVLDPKLLGVAGPSSPPIVPVGVFSESLGGYYAQVTKGATLATYILKFFQPSGAELGAGAYPAATGGTLVLEIAL